MHASFKLVYVQSQKHSLSNSKQIQNAYVAQLQK